MRTRWEKVAALVLVATTAAASGFQAKPVHLRKPRRGFQVRMGSFEIPPGGERDVCEYRELPNAQPMDVQSMNLRMTNGAHHFVLWAYTGAIRDRSRFPAEIRDAPACIGLVEGDGPFSTADLFGMQRPNARVSFPVGVAVRLREHQQVFLNAHLRNFDPEKPLRPTVLFNLVRARPGTVRHHAEAMIVGNMLGIHVPPRGSQTLATEFSFPTDVHLVQVSPHQHKRGVHSTIAFVDATGTATQLVDNSDWEHAQEYRPPAPRAVRAGEKLRLTCEWRNETERTIAFGTTTEDEMCFILGYYYRDDETQAMPRSAECLPQATGLLCPFAPAVP